MIQQDNDYLIFEGIGKKNMPLQKQAVHKEPISGHYDSLFDELYEKCNPNRFMEPYDKEKIDQANDIFSQLLKPSTKTNLIKLKELRSKALNQLGIEFCTETLYKRLIEKCHPRNFSGEYYDAQRLTEANNLYDEILRNADNIEVLEECEIKAKGLITILVEREQKEQKEQIKQEKQNEQKTRIENLRLRIENCSNEIFVTKVITGFIGTILLYFIHASITEANYLFVVVLGLIILIIILIISINKENKEKEELERQYNNEIKKQ